MYVISFSMIMYIQLFYMYFPHGSVTYWI